MRVVETFTQGGFPKLVLESKREFASKYGLKCRILATFQTGRVAGSAGLPEDEPEGPRDALSRRSIRTRTKRTRSSRIIARQADGTALTSIPSRRRPIRHPSTTGSRICCWRTRISARRPNSMSARLTDTRQHPQSAAAGYAAIYRIPRAAEASPTRSSRTPSSAIRSQARSNLPTHSRRMNTLRRFSERPPMTCTR